jgi:hypothetical protein
LKTETLNGFRVWLAWFSKQQETLNSFPALPSTTCAYVYLLRMYTVYVHSRYEDMYVCTCVDACIYEHVLYDRTWLVEACRMYVCIRKGIFCRVQCAHTYIYPYVHRICTFKVWGHVCMYLRRCMYIRTRNLRL